MSFSFSALLSCVIVTLLTGCGVHHHISSDSVVLVKEVDIPSSEMKLAQFATHTYIEYREDIHSSWYRVEVRTPGSGVEDVKVHRSEVVDNMRYGERVRILSQSNGEGYPHLIRDIRGFAKAYDDSIYRSYPGPNSNTFMERMIRDVDGLSAILDHNAIGKEHGFYVGRTAGGTGLELQSPIVGVALGMKEGLDVNVIGLSAGVSIYPPSIRIPFLPKLPTWE